MGELERITLETGYSRFPVREGRRLLGFVHVKDVLIGAASEPDAAADEPLARHYLHALPVLRPGMPLPDVLTALRRARSHMGDVVAGGQSLGVVALEDVVEQVVGGTDAGEERPPAPGLRVTPAAAPPRRRARPRVSGTPGR